MTQEATSTPAPSPSPSLPPPDAIPSSPSATAPPEAVEAMRKLNEQRPQAGFGIQMALGMPSNPIHQKVNEAHITQALGIASKSLDNDFWTGIVDRVMQLLVLGVAVGVGVFIIKTFSGQPTILVPALTAFGGYIAGALSGVGIAKAMSKSKG